jgi:hypothetical protein
MLITLACLHYKLLLCTSLPGPGGVWPIACGMHSSCSRRQALQCWAGFPGCTLGTKHLVQQGQSDLDPRELEVLIDKELLPCLFCPARSAALLAGPFPSVILYSSLKRGEQGCRGASGVPHPSGALVLPAPAPQVLQLFGLLQMSELGYEVHRESFGGPVLTPDQLRDWKEPGIVNYWMVNPEWLALGQAARSTAQPSQ